MVPCVWVNILARLLLIPKRQKYYGDNFIYERHRHRFEVNNDYREQLEQAGMIFSGRAPDNRIVEMMETEDHRWYIADAIPSEFESRPNRPHSFV